MHVLRPALLLLEALVGVVQCAPRASPITDHYLPHELRDLNATARGIVRLVPRLDPVLGVRWTLDRTCYEDEPKKNAVIDAVNAAKARSKLAVENLGEWGKDPAKVEQLAILLPDGEPEDHATSIAHAIKMFGGIASIEGPVGSPTFADSQEWQDLANRDLATNDHWRNIVIYCGPDIERVTRGARGEQWYDYGQKMWLKDTNSLVEMKNDVDSGADAPTKGLEAVTVVSGPEDEGSGDRTPKEKRRGIAATITIHPLYFKTMKVLNTGEIFTGGDKDITAIADALTAGTTAKISQALGLTSVIHHELFHTPGLGDLLDPTDDSYDWHNMMESGDQEAPDWYMFMGLMVEFMERGIKIDEDGVLQRP